MNTWYKWVRGVLLEGGNVGGDEAEDSGRRLWGRPAQWTTRVGSGRDFADGCAVLCRAQACLATGVDLMLPVPASQTS